MSILAKPVYLGCTAQAASLNIIRKKPRLGSQHSISDLHQLPVPSKVHCCFAATCCCRIVRRSAVQVYSGRTALVVSLENITENVYLGNQRSMTITNCLFRLGGAAALLSNKRRHWWTARCLISHTQFSSNRRVSLKIQSATSWLMHLLRSCTRKTDWKPI